jgi:hypothetical protein
MNTMEEGLPSPHLNSRFQGLAQSLPRQKLSAITAEDLPRFSTGVEEFDRVLGGGLVPGGVVLLGGDPGIGKSTLLLQALAEMSAAGMNVLYSSGEESAAQIALRAKRIALDAPQLEVLAEIRAGKADCDYGYGEATGIGCGFHSDFVFRSIEFCAWIGCSGKGVRRSINQSGESKRYLCIDGRPCH